MHTQDTHPHYSVHEIIHAVFCHVHELPGKILCLLVCVLINECFTFVGPESTRVDCENDVPARASQNASLRLSPVEWATETGSPKTSLVSCINLLGKSSGKKRSWSQRAGANQSLPLPIFPQYSFGCCPGSSVCGYFGRSLLLCGQQ